MSNIIKQLEQEQMKQDVPSFRPGDTVEVKVWVVEGSKKRLQAFEGVVIAIRNRGLHSAFTVRKISNGEGVERVFQTHSPVVDSISVKRRGAVRKAKLYYLRERTGKAARIKERRPWAVLLLAMGYFFPKPCVVRLLRGICPPIAHASATTFARFNDKPSL